MTMKITPAMLRQAGACKDQVLLFEQLWPNGATVTLARCLKAVQLGLNLGWAAANLLSATARKKYSKDTAPAWKKFRKDTAAAREKFDKDTAAAREKFDKDTAPAWKKFDKDRDAAWVEYEKDRDAAWVEYEKDTAAAFYKASRLIGNNEEVTR